MVRFGIQGAEFAGSPGTEILGITTGGFGVEPRSEVKEKFPPQMRGGSSGLWAGSGTGTGDSIPVLNHNPYG